MKYVLYSPQHTVTIPEIEKTNGEVIPEREHTVSPRALYRHKRFPDRRYRRDYPDWDKETKLVICRTLEEAREEQEALRNYCGEVFEIRSYSKGEIGPEITAPENREEKT